MQFLKMLIFDLDLQLKKLMLTNAQSIIEKNN